MKRKKKKILMIAAAILVALIALSNALSNKAPIPAEEDSPSPALSTMSDDVSPPASVKDDASTATQPPVAEEETAYLKLTKDNDAYLLFLQVIGTCYKDNSLTREMFDEMAQYNGVQSLVEEVLNYRYQEGTLSPDFIASFSAFWTEDVAFTHPEILEALQISFDVEYNLIDKAWVLKENEATVAANKQGDFEWLPATGHLYPGVEVYIVTDDTTTLYGTITSLTDKDVEIYLTASDEAQWFGRRIPMISKVLKVRSNDPHLPQY